MAAGVALIARRLPAAKDAAMALAEEAEALRQAKGEGG